MRKKVKESDHNSLSKYEVIIFSFFLFNFSLNFQMDA